MPGPLHSALVHYAMERLRKEGYDVFAEVRLGPGLVVDVMGTKKDQKCVVECQVQFQPGWIKRRIKDLKKVANRVIYCIPGDAVLHPQFRDGIEVWQPNQLRGERKHDILIRVPKDEYPGISRAKLKLQSILGKEVTWYEILQSGIATRLAWADDKGKKK